MKKKIYLAAGCFWGAEHYLKQIEGITFTQVGFANGNTENPTYEQVYTDLTGYAEAVLVEYDSYIIPLRAIIRLYFKAIDPTSLNRQGADFGTRYRTGIYYDDKSDLPIIQGVMALEAKKYDSPLQVEVVPLKNFYPADDYHQDYLDKNPTGYCHLPIELFAYAKNYKPISVKIRESLFANQDLGYRDFHSKLMPTIEKERIIGVRTPQLRKLAKEYAKDAEIDDFLSSLPHQYYDENNLHGFVIAEMKDYDRSIAEIDRFLPYIDNWATCDLIRPKSFNKNHSRLIKDIHRWMKSRNTYTIRFGIEMLMTHFLDDDFCHEYLEWVASITNDEYYVKMMVAWYFATALAKQYEVTLPIIEQKRLVSWTHNKTIQKAIESYRITNEQKEYLKGMKIRDSK